MEKTYSIKKNARVAGLLYLILAITSIFGLVYVASQIVVPDDTLATVNNIIASEMMFRLGIISNLLYLIVFVFLVLSFYNLLKDVNKKLAMLMVSLVIAGVPAAFINELNHLAILTLLNGGEFLKEFGSDQQYALAQLFLSLHEYGSKMVGIFWGLWLLPLGLLVIKSKFIPQIIGVLLIIGCFGYVIAGFTFLISPHYGRIVFPIVTMPSAIAEVVTILWLIIKGTKEQKPKTEEIG